MTELIINITTSDLQPSTAIANQLPDKLVFIQIELYKANLFQIHHSIDNVQQKDYMNSWVTVWFYAF